MTVAVLLLSASLACLGACNVRTSFPAGTKHDSDSGLALWQGGLDGGHAGKVSGSPIHGSHEPTAEASVRWVAALPSSGTRHSWKLGSS